MSGQQIGMVVGGAIGFFAGGNVALGMSIGGAIGGALDPPHFKAPGIGDPRPQTSQAGMPIPKFFGKPKPQPCTVIDGDPLARKIYIETEQGKGGGPTVTSEGWIATRAFLVGEADEPLAGIGRIRRNGKLVYSTIAGDDLDADSAAFSSQLRIYLGGHTQLPDPSLEAIHGVGNTPYHRGKCYFVVIDDDETNTGGGWNQYEVEPIVSGTASGGAGFTFGVQTHTYTLPSDTSSTYDAYRPNYCKGTDDGLYVAYADPESTVGAGADAYVQKQLDNTLTEVSGKSITQDGGGRFGVFAFAASEKDSQWSISSNERPQLFRNGTYCCDLTIGGDNTWWFGQGTYSQEFGGLIWFDIPTGMFGASGTVYIGARRSGSPVATRNRLYAWDLTTTPGSYDPVATSSLICPTATDTFWMHMDRSSSLWTISTDGHLKQWDGSLTLQSDYTLPAGLAATISGASFDAFGVDGNYLFCFSRAGTSLKVYELGTWTLVQTIALTGSFDDYNCQVQFNNDSIFVRSGRHIKRIAYHASCVVGLPAGWYQLPDTPNYVSSPSGDLVPICGTEGNRIDPDAAILKDIIADVVGRTPCPVSKLNIDNLLDEVPGYAIDSADITATEVIRDLLGIHFADIVEYDGKLNGIYRGGATVATIADSDILALDDEDDDTREQALEYNPLRVTVIYPDPANNYVDTPATSPRDTPDVVATGELVVQTSIPYDATTARRKAEILQKVVYARAEGGRKRALRAEHARLVASDAILIEGRREMIIKKDEDLGMVRVETAYDRASAYQSITAGVVAPPPTPQTSNLKGPTRFVAFNSPQLREEDDGTGLYAAACGILPNWPGCMLQVSVDADFSVYTPVLQMTRAAVIGVLQDACTASSEPISIATTGSMSSVTSAQLAARANAWAIIAADGTVEVGQSLTVTDNAAGGQDLTGNLRGQLGSQAAAHYAGEGFCLLDTAVYYVRLNDAYVGQTIRFRPVTNGTSPAAAPTFDVVLQAQEIIWDGTP